MNTARHPSPSRPEIVTGSILALLFLVLLGTAFGRMGEKGQITKSIANCRQIIIAIRLYAADEGGRYPDSAVPTAKDSNTAFKQLIIAGSLEDEKIFGCGASSFIPDGDIGTKPLFTEAVEPGENHWAMTKGLDDSTEGGIPLVYENPVEATWDPTWNADAAEAPLKGRAWKGAKVIIGTNDTSVEMMKLASLTGAKVPLKSLGSEGKNLFTQYVTKKDGTPYEMLDIAWSPSMIRPYALDSEPSSLPLVIGGIILALIILFLVRRSRSRHKLLEMQALV
jgi:hypothetical protein